MLAKLSERFLFKLYIVLGALSATMVGSLVMLAALFVFKLGPNPEAALTSLLGAVVGALGGALGLIIGGLVTFLGLEWIGKLNIAPDGPESDG